MLAMFNEHGIKIFSVQTWSEKNYIKYCVNKFYIILIITIANVQFS